MCPGKSIEWKRKFTPYLRTFLEKTTFPSSSPSAGSLQCFGQSRILEIPETNDLITLFGVEIFFKGSKPGQND